MKVIPYLEFDGCCEEALEFYREKLDAELGPMMRFKDSPDQSQIDPNNPEKVLHTSFKVGNTTLYASDGYCNGNASFSGVSMTLVVETEEQVRRYFGNLENAGGRVVMPLEPTFFAKLFGLVSDRFGVTWIIHCE